jgi:predicted dehydrogenase
VTGLQLSRADFYEKELSFQVSCSYGPGRYDPAYEEGGQDYPVGFVRWTEQRNFEAVLDLMTSGALDCAPLVSHRFELEQAADAYELLAGGEPSLGILLRHGSAVESRMARVSVLTVDGQGSPAPKPTRAAPRLAVIGAGNYASRVLIPAFKAAGADLRVLVSEAGVSATHYGRKFGFARASTSAEEAIAAGDCDTVVIATRHDSHARYVCAALHAGKHVFVEKPLCLTLEELAEIEAALADARAAGHAAQLMVGFNRRFAPQVVTMKRLLSTVSGTKAVVITVNAGAIPADHWTQDPSKGGGRVVGEACHFIDLARHLVGAPIESAERFAMDSTTGDTVSLQLRHVNGSISTIHYFANGHRAVAKERVEVYAQGRVLQLDNFRVLHGFGWPGFSKQRLWRQDKGQGACAAAFVEALRSGSAASIEVDELIEVSRWAVELG